MYCWIVTQAFDQLGIKPKKVIIAGDSAGGALAAAVTQICIFEGFRKPDGLILPYPCTTVDLRMFSPAMMMTLDDPLLSQDMFYFTGLFLHNA